MSESSNRRISGTTFWRLVFAVLLVGTLGLTLGHTEQATKPAQPTDLLQFSSGAHALGFRAGGIHVAAGDGVLRVDFVGTAGVTPVADPRPSRNQPASSFDRVTYSDLWPGITLSYQRAAGGIVQSTYLLDPGANAAQIRLHYSSPLEIEAGGSLRIQHERGYLRESAPIAWQDIDGQRLPVEVSFCLPESPIRKSILGFSLGRHNPAYPVIIDPVLEWNTPLAGGWRDSAYAIAVDEGGNAYLAGHSEEWWGSPVDNPYSGVEDALIAKLDGSGAVEWHTFLGGGGVEEGTTAYGAAVDGSGNVVVGGFSWLPWFGASEPLIPHSGGDAADAFVAKLNGSGELIWHLFIGSYDSGDSVFGITVDGSGNAYVAGLLGGGQGWPADGFVAKLNSNGVLLWGALLGSSEEADYATGIAVDGDGNVYVTGHSMASWGDSPVNDHSGAGGLDVFAAKLSSNGALLWNTFMGSSNRDQAGEIAVDGDGNAYVVGWSAAGWDSQPVNGHSGYYDAFVAKLDGSGGLVWHTFMGSSQLDYGNDIAVDGRGGVYVVGDSNGTWGLPDPGYGHSGGTDAFVAKLDGSGDLLWNAFMGSSSLDRGYAVAADGINSVFVAGDDAAGAFVAKLIPDDDGDGVPNPEDNCLGTSNPAQADSDLDGFGNLCDADFDDNGGAGISDYTYFQANFGTWAPSYDEQVDMDCNDAVGISDWTLFQNFFGTNYGAGQTVSGLACAGAGTVPCPATAHGCPP